MGFAGTDQRVLVFAYPTKTRPKVSSPDGTKIELLWTDDFEVQFTGPVGVVHDGYEWSYDRRVLSRIAYPYLNREEYDRFKNRPSDQ